MQEAKRVASVKERGSGGQVGEDSNFWSEIRLGARDYVTMLVLFVAVCLGYLLFCGSLPITDPVESNYALTAKQMLQHNDWISPMIYDRYWYDKPIFTYWMLMLSYKAFGFTDLASRLPGALFGAITIPGFFYMMRKIVKSYGPALLGACVLMTSFEYWYLAHAVVTDMYLFSFMLGIFYFAYQGLTKNSKGYMCGAYAMAAMAVLDKGPVGLVLPGCILVIFLLCSWAYSKLLDRSNGSLASPSFRGVSLGHRFFLLFYPPAILLFLIIALPWYIEMYRVHGQSFVDGFLLLHNMERATVSEHPRFDVWYYYLLVIPVTLMPWAFMTLYGMKQSLVNLYRAFFSHALPDSSEINVDNMSQSVGQSQVGQSDIRAIQTEALLAGVFMPKRAYIEWQLYLWVWLAGIVLFFSVVATKYPTYTFPAVISLVVLTVEGCQHLRTCQVSWRRMKTALLLYVPIAALCFGLFKAAHKYLGTGLPLLVTVVIGVVVLILIGTCLYAFKAKQLVKAKVSMIAEEAVSEHSQFEGLEEESLAIQNDNKSVINLVSKGEKDFGDRGVTALLAGTIASMIILFGALAASLGPIISAQSAKAWAPYVSRIPGQSVYIYDDYLTSLNYYSDKRITRILTASLDKKNIWEVGKYVMPLTSKEQAARDLQVKPDMVILVPKSAIKFYKGTALYQETKALPDTPKGLYVFVKR